MKKEWKMTLGEVVKLPMFKQAEVLAGSRVFNRAIRGVRIWESHGEPNLHFGSGELVFSYGQEFCQEPAQNRSMLHDLINQQTAGLCVELGTYLKELPPCLIELANQQEYPLMVFHPPVNFLDISLQIQARIVNQQTQSMRELDAYSRSLQRLTFEGQSLAQIMNHFQRVVQSQTFYLAFDGQSLFVPTMTKMIQNEMIELLQQNLFAKERIVLDSGILPISEQKNIIYQPIVAMGQVLACLGVVLYEQEPDEFLFLLLDYTANAIAQLLVRKLFAEERELDIQDRLLDEILQDKIKQEAHIRAQLDIKAEESHPPAYLAAVLELVQGPQHSMNNRDFTFHDLLGVFRSLFYRQGFRTLLRSKGNRLYLLLLEAGTGIDYRKQLQKAIAELKRTCSQTLGRDVQIQYGVSRLSRRYAHAYHHFQEAEQVLSFSSHAISPFFDDLGIYRLLMHVEQGHVIDSFIEDYLGPLLRHDHAHGSQLLLTLRTFLDQHGSKQEAAERLFISRQTLYQRLEKIGELLGDSYLAPEHRICLELALRSHEWVTQAKSR